MGLARDTAADMAADTDIRNVYSYSCRYGCRYNTNAYIRNIDTTTDTYRQIARASHISKDTFVSVRLLRLPAKRARKFMRDAFAICCVLRVARSSFLCLIITWQLQMYLQSVRN